MRTYVHKKDLALMRANTGQNILELSERQPVMLVFLRHFGCTFCRVALAELSAKQEHFKGIGTQLVFVHMSDDEHAKKFFQRYDIRQPIHVSDPEKRFYQTFGLSRGTFNQLFGLSTWIRGIHEGAVNGHGIGREMGDGFQMPGVFLIRDGVIKDQFIHQRASDQPDYTKLAECCLI